MKLKKPAKPESMMKHVTRISILSVLALGSAHAAVVTITNAGFEGDGVVTTGFLNAAPTGWTRITTTNTTVGIIGETRAPASSVMLTPDGVAWAHLQVDETNPAVNIPYLGQNIGTVGNSLFTGPDDQLQVGFLVGKRRNGDTNVSVTVSLYTSDGADWTSGSLIDTQTFATTLLGLGANDIGSGSVTLDLDNTIAQTNGGNYWLVFSNTQSTFGGVADSAAQLQLDAITANTIPEPSAALLGGLGGLMLLRRRRA